MAKLKYRIGRLEEVDEAHRGLYVQKDDVFELDAEDPPGLVDAINTERTEHGKTKKALKALHVDGKPIDVTKYTELLGKEAALDQALKLQEGKVNEVVAAQQKEFDKERGGWRTEREQLVGENGTLKRQMVRDTVKRALRDAFTKARGRAEFVDDIERRADEFSLFEGKVYRLDDDGESPKRHPKESLRYYEPEDFIADLAKVKTAMFEGSGGGGGGGAGDRRLPPPGVIDRNDSAAVLANVDGLASGKTRAQ